MANAKQARQEAELVDDFPETEESTSGAEGLAALGAALMKAGQSGASKEQVASAMATLKEVLPSLDFKRFPELRDDPVIEAFLEQLSEEKANAADVPPGTVIDRGKPTERVKDWTEQDLKKSAMGLVTFTPSESLPVIWNGLRCDLVADVEITTYRCFYDVYMEHKFEQRFARAHAEWLMQQRRDLPHPDMALPDGIRARAAGTSGTLAAGAGLFDVGTSEIPAEALKEGGSGEAAI